MIICLVRPNRVSYEESYWDAHLQDLQQSLNDDSDRVNGKTNVLIKVMPYEMLDHGGTLYDALQTGIQHYITSIDQNQSENSPPHCSISVYHIASVFGPTPDPIQTAMDNVQSAEDVVQTLDRFRRHFFQKHSNHVKKTTFRLVLTSSMAAVRATNQPPLNQKYYTHRDWNTLSQLDSASWGSCYQWSKAESERRAWDLIRECNQQWNKREGNEGNLLEMVALCPSFVFGPPPPFPGSWVKRADDATTRMLTTNGSGSTSYSLQLLNQWLKGTSPVQSRLCADVRDVAQAHVAAGAMDVLPTEFLGDSKSFNMRYIVSREERLRSELVAEALRRAIQRVHEKSVVERSGSGSIDTSMITCDTKFDGGAIKIGEREVEATERLKSDLGVVCRSVEETMQDMAEAMLSGEAF